MAKRVHKALSMMPEDLERLRKLSKAAGMNESSYIRVLLLNEEARIEGRRVTSNNVGYDEKESPSGDEEGAQDREEARFLTNNLPKKYIYWEAVNEKTRKRYLYPTKANNWIDASYELKRNWYIGCSTEFHFLTREEAAIMAVKIYQEEKAAEEYLKKMGIKL